MFSSKSDAFTFPVAGKTVPAPAHLHQHLVQPPTTPVGGLSLTIVLAPDNDEEPLVTLSRCVFFGEDLSTAVAHFEDLGSLFSDC